MTTKKDDANTTFVTIRMPKDIVKAIDELAIESVRSRSSQIVVMLKQALQNQQP